MVAESLKRLQTIIEAMLNQMYPEFDAQVSCKRIFVPMNVNFNLKNYLNREGRSQVYLILTSSGSRKRIPLDIYVNPECWDKTKQRAKPKTEDCETINLLLDQAFAKISEIRIHYRLSKLHLSLDTLVDEFKNKTPNYDFIAFMKHHADNLVIKKITYQKHQSEIKKLAEFKSNIPFSDITHEFINNYRGFLVNTKKNAPTTIASSMKIIMKFLRLAKKFGIFLNIDLSAVEIGSTKGNRVNLTLEEVARLKAYYESEFIKEHHKITLGYFLFSCYTSMRISDVKNRRRDDLYGTSVSYVSTKTGKNHTIVLNKTAKEIVDDNPDLFVKWKSDQKINEALKQIANICSIKKIVTFHTARHSFATNFLRKGGKVEDLQVIMDHSDIQTTMVYVHIVRAESIKSMYLMDD